MHAADTLPDMPDPVADLPYATGDLPGIGGFIKHRDDDFLVEEQPAYQPCGEGEHCYLFVEKRGLASSEMLAVVAKHFGVEPTAVGYAGMKDKHAVTRQVVSIHTPGKSIDDFPMLEHPRVSVLWADMHANKLRVGHLRGNRFSIKVRGVSATTVVAARPVLDRLARTGIPNYYGPQRFGATSTNHLIGRADILGAHDLAIDLLLDPPLSPRLSDQEHLVSLAEAYRARDWAGARAALTPGQNTERAAVAALAEGRSPRDAIRAAGRLQRRFFYSAFQSALFNAVCADRLRAGALDRLVLGDVAFKHANHACFAVSDDELSSNAARGELERRIKDFEISASGPMWGADMMRASDEPGEHEDEVLARSGVTLDDLDRHANRLKSRLRGARRPLRAPVIDPTIDAGTDEHGHYVRLAFELPPGSFATTLVREIIKDGPRVTPGTLFDDDDRHAPHTQAARLAEDTEP